MSWNYTNLRGITLTKIANTLMKKPTHKQIIWICATVYCIAVLSIVFGISFNTEIRLFSNNISQKIFPSLSYTYHVSQHTFGGIEQYTDTANNRKVVFLPMKHIGTRKYYSKVKDYIESKMKNGYKVFDEGVRIEIIQTDSVDSERSSLERGIQLSQLDTLERKYRRVTGYALAYRTDSVVLADYLMHESHENMGTHDSMNVDMSYPEMIETYEREYKPITLTNYDYEVGLGDKYKVQDTIKHSRGHLQLIHRDEYLAARILASKHPKILIVYGGAHRKGVRELLEKGGFEVE